MVGEVQTSLLNESQAPTATEGNLGNPNVTITTAVLPTGETQTTRITSSLLTDNEFRDGANAGIQHLFPDSGNEHNTEVGAGVIGEQTARIGVSQLSGLMIISTGGVGNTTETSTSDAPTPQVPPIVAQTPTPITPPTVPPRIIDPTNPPPDEIGGSDSRSKNISGSRSTENAGREQGTPFEEEEAKRKETRRTLEKEEQGKERQFEPEKQEEKKPDEANPEEPKPEEQPHEPEPKRTVPERLEPRILEPVGEYARSIHEVKIDTFAQGEVADYFRKTIPETLRSMANVPGYNKLIKNGMSSQELIQSLEQIATEPTEKQASSLIKLFAEVKNIPLESNTFETASFIKNLTSTREAMGVTGESLISWNELSELQRQNAQIKARAVPQPEVISNPRPAVPSETPATVEIPSRVSTPVATNPQAVTITPGGSNPGVSTIEPFSRRVVPPPVTAPAVVAPVADAGGLNLATEFQKFLNSSADGINAGVQIVEHTVEKVGTSEAAEGALRVLTRL